MTNVFRRFDDGRGRPTSKQDKEQGHRSRRRLWKGLALLLLCLPTVVLAQQPGGTQPSGGVKGVGEPEDVPLPFPIDPVFPGKVRMPALGNPEGTVGKTPMLTPLAKQKVQKYVDTFVDPEATLDLIVGRTRGLNLKKTPKRVQIADESVTATSVLSPRELLLQGRRVGQTVLSLWFADDNDATKEVNLTYLVRVLPDPEGKERLERAYKALEGEINKFFCESRIQLALLGDKLVVRGRVKDIAEGTQILRILRANAPGGQLGGIPLQRVGFDPSTITPTNPEGDPELTPSRESYLTAGGPNVVNLLTVPGEQQVQLRVTVAEVNRSAARSIGLNFSITNNQGISVFSNSTGLGAATGVFAAAAGSPVNLPIVLDGGQVPIALNALRTLNFARFLAEPTLVALNGQTASFQAGGQFPVPVIAGFSGLSAGALQGVQFVPFGVQVSFTPLITDKDRIRLNVRANVSTRDVATGSNIGGSAVPGISTRNFTTAVELREGETLAVAGLIQSNLGTDSSRVPFLGEIPLFGHLTGLTQGQASEQELVILVTPELVHPMKACDVPPLPGSDLFEPNDVEFYLMGRMESRRPYDYRSPIRTSLERKVEYHQIEKMYMSGPTGFSEGP